MDKIDEQIKKDIIESFDKDCINYCLDRANYVDDIGECVINSIIKAVKPMYEKANKL